jgi:hypothetical protein
MELADSAHTVARCENARMNAAMGAGKTGMSRNGPISTFATLQQYV